MIVSSKRCFFCLRANHNAINCTRPDKKRCVDCQLYHHRFVACPPYGNKVQPRTFSGLESSRAGGTSTLNANLTLSGSASECNIGRAREVASDADATFNTVGTLNSSQEGKIHRRYSPTTYVELQDVEKKWHRVVAFIDTGADTTLLKLSTAKHFGLQGEPFKFRYGVAGGGIAEESSAKFSIQIRPVNGIKSYNVIAIGIEKPAHNSPAVGGDIFDEYPHLNAARELAVRSILGWTIFGGNIPKPKPHAASRVQFLNHLEDLQKLYTSDVVGVKPTTLCVCSDKEIAESQFIKHCRNKLCINADGRMTVKMPWKPGFPEALECNKPQAEIRLMSQEKRLIKNGTFDEYSEEIQKLIDSCFVRELYPEESRDEGWYLQHHAVYQLHKSTKVRIVWNSAAKFNGLCLNDGFYKGPDFLNSLLYCLLHWRMKSIGIAGDVQKMFNQILMAEKDQRYHRFVWRFDLSSPIRHWQWLRLPFGDKPAPDIAMMAVRTLADTFKEEEPIGAQLINCRMYMDDVIESFDKSELAIGPWIRWIGY
ncbi:uncharacterized protein LOC135221349 [Macrobrachium nipponense]|uniref:uncharacterized protein LOC135221349 n=1 Tax=Macrobrachium nipponense TaxID=159736 RepID=UPI0030C8409F